METITARFNWTSDDLLTGRHFALKLNRWSPVAFGASLLIAVTVGTYTFDTHREKHGILIVSVIGGLIVIGLIVGFPLARMISRWLLRRQFAKRPDAGSEIVWEISENGINTSSSHSKSEIQWNAFQRVVSTPAGFLFMPNAQIFHFVPNRAFENDGEIAKLKELARRMAKDFKELK